MINCIILDDEPLAIKVIENFIKKTDFLNCLGSYSNANDSLDIIKKGEVDLMFLDINMPFLTGFEVIKKCQAASLETKFIILTSHKEKGFVVQAKKLNISGYMLKDEPFFEIKKCISAVLNGAFYASILFNDVFTKEVSPLMEKINYLSPSERTIVRLIAQNKSSKEIAEILSISQRTVDKHRSNIIAKLDVSSDSGSLAVWVKENKELLESV